jgi:hypothetical protein
MEVLDDRNKSHFEVVWDKEQVMKFAEFVLSMLKNTNSYLCLFLFSRVKYDPSIKKGDGVLKRIFIDEHKTANDFYRELLKLHVPKEAYDPPVSQQSLCIYAWLRPSDPLRPMCKVFNECIDAVSMKRDLPKKLISRYHEEIGKTAYALPADAVSMNLVQLDIDSKDPVFIDKLKSCLKEANVLQEIKIAVETKNGYHVVFQRTKECDLSMLYNFKMDHKVTKKSRDGKDVTDFLFDWKKQPQVIIPGTYQGGFQARFTNVFF